MLVSGGGKDEGASVSAAKAAAKSSPVSLVRLGVILSLNVL